MNKTTLTPAEHANIVQGLQLPVALNSGRVASPSASAVIASFLCDGPMSIRNLRAKAGTCGSASATTVIVKKNGVSVASVSIDNADADGIQKVGLPASDALASCDAGDLITIETGTAATAVANLDATCHIDARFA
jgi:hypothetical protein